MVSAISFVKRIQEKIVRLERMPIMTYVGTSINLVIHAGSKMHLQRNSTRINKKRGCPGTYWTVPLLIASNHNPVHSVLVY